MVVGNFNRLKSGGKVEVALKLFVARARASSLFTSIDRGGWCGIADRLWKEQEEGAPLRGLA